MKHSVAAILREDRPNNQGNAPIYIRVIIDRKSSYKSTGYFVNPKQWDSDKQRVKSSHNMADIWNLDIINQLKKIESEIVLKKVDGKKITSRQARNHVTFTPGSNYFSFVDNYIIDQRERKKKEEGTLENYRKHTLRFEQYIGSRQLLFEEITADLLIGFEKHLHKEELKQNYIHVVVRTIRTMFNAAIKKKVTSEYPFKEYDLPEIEDQEKDYLSLDEVDMIERLADETADPSIRQTCIYLLLGCYTGLRLSDWLAFSLEKNIKEDSIMLRATKNGEWVSIPMTRRLLRTIERIRNNPLNIEEQTLNRMLKKVALAIGSDKHLTTHSGRHTFAITMCAERGVSLETCATLMGITVEVCFKNYYRVTANKIKSETGKAWAGL